MVDPQTSFLLYTVGLVIEILGAWSMYASLPGGLNMKDLDMERFYTQTRRGCFNLGLFLTLGLLMQYLAGF